MKKQKIKTVSDYINQNTNKNLNILDLLKNSKKIKGQFSKKQLNGTHSSLRYLFGGKVISSKNFFIKPDLFYIWSIKEKKSKYKIISQATKANAPVLFFEDGFISRTCNTASIDKKLKYRIGCSYTIDDKTCYYDATTASRLELMLNDKNLIISNEQIKRARSCINKIIKNNLSKYNHQPIYQPKIGREGVKKVLVIDQSYGDMSVEKGLANDNSFKDMLNAAIKDNPNADIIVKIHPDAIAKRGSGKKLGYYTEIEEKDNIYLQSDAINPISLIDYVDKVYVCTTQFGFEALMCGKEVCAFGMPFYAGWGLTKDSLTCNRRDNKRTLEEIFYITYIMYSHYANPKTKTRCEIEDAIDYLLEQRKEYFALMQG